MSHHAQEELSIRPMVEADKPHIIEAVEATDMFTGEEVDVAEELIDIYLTKKDQKDYIIFVADLAGRPAGYVCYGPTPAAEGTFDLYWIAVAPELHKRGIGKRLLKYTEEEVSRKAGRLVVIETSSQPKYKATQDFYLRNGYAIEARIKDFYRDGDDRLIFTKRLAKN